MEKEIEHIIFDLGGVLVNIDLVGLTEGFNRLMYPNEANGRNIREKIIPAYEIGAISSNEFLDQLQVFLKTGFTRNQIAEVWNDIFLDFPKERLEMLTELRKRYKVHLLSNINEMHALGFEMNFRNWFNQDPKIYFDHFFYSHLIGKRKPDANTFRWAAKEIDSRPEKILFIDDLAENVEGARSIGIHAEHLKLDETDIISLMKKLGYYQ